MKLNRVKHHIKIKEISDQFNDFKVLKGITIV